MSAEEQNNLRMLLKEALRVPFTIVSGLAILAIAGWIGIAVSDHFSIKELERDRDVMKPRVEVLWHRHDFQKK